MWWVPGACVDPVERPQSEPVHLTEYDACALDPENGLRVVCEWPRDEPGPVELGIAVAWEGAPRVFPGDEDALDVRIVAWDLLAETGYTWEIVDRGERVAAGALRTDPLPTGVDVEVVVSVDGPTSVERLLVPAACTPERDGHVVVLDAEGRVRWYQPTGSSQPISALDATDRGTVLALLGRTTVREWTFAGERVLDVLAPGADLERLAHHAIVGRGGRTLVLDTSPVEYPDGRSYLMDGVSEVGVGHLWGLDEVLDPQGSIDPIVPTYWAPFYPGAVDFAHENGLWLEPDGSWLLSFKHLDTVAGLDPDGQISWSMTGSPETSPPFPAERLVFTSSAGLDASFEYPHTPVTSPWGTLLVLDNGRGGDASRVLEIAIDSGARTADLVRAWDLGVSCPVQSSVLGLEDGTVLAACTRTGEVFELDDTGIRRRSTIQCRNGIVGGGLVRAQPVAL